MIYILNDLDINGNLMKTNMKTEELFTSESSGSQSESPTVSSKTQSKKCRQVNKHHLSSAQVNATSNPNHDSDDSASYASTDYASNDADYNAKATSMLSNNKPVSSETVTDDERANKRLHASDESGATDILATESLAARSGEAKSLKNKATDVNADYRSIDSGYKKDKGYKKKAAATDSVDNHTDAKQDSAFSNQKIPSEQVDTAYQGFATSDTSQKASLSQQDSLTPAARQKIEIPERVFMNSLIKHTAIALAIIVPLAAFSAYAAPQAMPISEDNGKTTTETIEIAPSMIIHKSADEPTTVDSIDLNKYVGTWYEIGRLPMYFQRHCTSDVTATYTAKAEGSGISVLNKCIREDGKSINAEGLAKPSDETGSKLKVTFLPSWIRWLPVGRADYWVLAHDPSYQTALVGTPDKDYLWLLARSPNISQETYAKYRQIAQQQGYGLKEFKLTDHASQTVKLVP